MDKLVYTYANPVFRVPGQVVPPVARGAKHAGIDGRASQDRGSPEGILQAKWTCSGAPAFEIDRTAGISRPFDVASRSRGQDRRSRGGTARGVR